MPQSSKIDIYSPVWYRQFNLLREDVLNPTLGHPHDGSAEGGKKIDIKSLVGTDAQSFINLFENADFEIGDPPTWWEAWAGGTKYREATIVKIGAYSCRLAYDGVAADAALGKVAWQNEIPYGFDYWKGRKITMGAWVYSSDANRVAMRLFDGVNWFVSSYHPGDSSWRWLTITADIDPAATQLHLQLLWISGGTAISAYIDGAIAVEGGICPAFSPRPAYAPVLTVAETEVFNGTSPTTWTDLDLSGTIGAQSSLVLLKVYHAGTETVAFRKNGDVDEFYALGGVSGVALIETYSGVHIVVLVATDASGIIEWRASGAVAMTIDVIAYIK